MILLLIGCLLGITIYFVFLKDPAPVPFDNKKYDQLEKDLETQAQLYESQIKTLKASRKIYELTVDSLLTVKQKIKLVYVKDLQKIDTINNNALVSEFQGIFAAANID